jgi:hypothetical protein
VVKAICYKGSRPDEVNELGLGVGSVSKRIEEQKQKHVSGEQSFAGSQG